MCDVEPIHLEGEKKCEKETKPPDWKPKDCNIEANDCCPSIDPAKAFPDPSADEAEADTFKLETYPFDPRFPNTNQTKHCYVSFLEHKRCIKIRGEDYTPCEYFKRVYTSMCPKAWVEKWEDQINKGTFPGRI